MSEKIITPEHMLSTKMDLKLPGNVSISQNQKFSDHTASSQTNALVPSLERISAFDSSTNNNNISISTNITPSTSEIMGTEAGMTSRNLHPRHHMDKLSEYDS